MISILKNNQRSYILSCVCLLAWLYLVLLSPIVVFAQSNSSQTISVSPTLFEMKAAPGQNWQSELRVVNVNNYDMTVYLQVVDFEPLDETGRVDLLFNKEEESSGPPTLSSWIDITRDPITIPAQKTMTVPFSVIAPFDAPPGGHYAAILVGTRPPVNKEGISQVQTAQFVTSLLFVRVDGNIVEQGQVREFRTSKMIVPEPDINFELRFENTGNVYIQPQGEIVIYNMWGTKRGTIPVNHQTHYGRVMQNSVREFIFSWKGETTFLDIGRYKAVATLGYGESKKQFATSTTYFWIIPYQQIFIALLVIAAIFMFISWVVRLYIRRMLMLAGIDPDIHRQYAIHRQPQTLKLKRAGVHLSRPDHSLLAPIKYGVLDIKEKLAQRNPDERWTRTFTSLFMTYRLFVLSLVGLVLILLLLWLFFSSMLNADRQYEVTIVNPDAPVKLSSEEMYYQTIVPAEGSDDQKIIDQDFDIEIINRSGVLGVGANVRVMLEGKGYTVEKLGTELGESSSRTVIVFNPKDQESALALSQTLKGALLSASEQQESSTIKIFTGTDFMR